MRKIFPYSVIYNGVFYKANESIEDNKKQKGSDNHETSTTENVKLGNTAPKES